MTTGFTTTSSLADSLPVIVDAARIVREFEGVMPQLVERVTLGEGIGLSWNEISLAQLTAQSVTENTILNNPQQITDTLFTITPTSVRIQLIITDEVRARISRNAFARIGVLGGNAMQRKKDEDGLTALDGATTQLGSAGSSLASGNVAAAGVRITSNVTEPGREPLRGVFHGFQLYDIRSELLQGLTPSTNPEQLIPGAMGDFTPRVFTEGFMGRVNKVQVFEDGNLTIDSADDAKGGVFARDALVLVQGRAPRTETRRRPDIGGTGADEMFMSDEFAYGERSAGNWLFEVISDATAPTS